MLSDEIKTKYIIDEFPDIWSILNGIKTFEALFTEIDIQMATDLIMNVEVTVLTHLKSDGKFQSHFFAKSYETS